MADTPNRGPYNSMIVIRTPRNTRVSDDSGMTAGEAGDACGNRPGETGDRPPRTASPLEFTLPRIAVEDGAFAFHPLEVRDAPIGAAAFLCIRQCVSFIIGGRDGDVGLVS